MTRSVTIIPATIHPHTNSPIAMPAKRRVAAYARVSTDSEEQLTSYEAQVDYYTRYIQAKPEWEFVRIYTDEGITATNTKKRDGFNQMVKDALAGQIDLIITKSVSRFARNTVDSLITVRKLKDKGIEIFFEKENIYTLDSKGELLITLLSSLAQEESRSISENVTWGLRKRFSDGIFSLPYGQFLGYEKGADGLPQIIETEAITVREIYKLFLEGKTPCGIATILTNKKIPTPSKRSEKWSPTTIESILTNEKYKGSALLQKGFTADFLTKKKKINRGEVPQYYIEHSHAAIIDPDIFDLVQAEIARRKAFGKKYSGSSIFSCKLICEDCGEFFGAKVWHSTDVHRRTVWRCNHKYDKSPACATPFIEENTIKEKFVEAYNSIFSNRQELLDDLELVTEILTSSDEINATIESLKSEIEIVEKLAHRCMEADARMALPCEDIMTQYNVLIDRYETAKARLEELTTEKMRKQQQACRLKVFIKDLKEREIAIPKFDEKLWFASIDTVIVRRDGSLRFVFQNKKVVEVC